MMRKTMATAMAALVLGLAAVVAVPAPAQAGPYSGDCTFSISIVFANPGDVIEVQGEGLPPFLDVKVLLRDQFGTFVPEVDIDIDVFADGAFSGTVTVPDDAIAGFYTLIIPCTPAGLLGPTASTVIIVTSFLPSFNFVITPFQFPFFNFSPGVNPFSTFSATPGPTTPTTAATSTAVTSTPRVRPLEKFGAFLAGLRPGSKVSLTRLGDGAPIGTTTVDSNGVARLVTSLPAAFRAGLQRFRAVGLDKDNNPFELISTVELVAPDGGSDSGDSGIGPYATAGGILGLGGAALVTVRRRRAAS